MRKVFLILSICFLLSCSNEVNTEQGALGSEVVYGGSTNLSISIYKYTVDSVVYIVAARREGIAIIKHGVIQKQ